MFMVRAEEVWLVIGASDTSTLQIAKKAKKLADLSDNGFVVQMSDCNQDSNIFAWTADVKASQSEARPILDSLRKTVKDAYLKRCDVIPHSLLAHRISAVDPSIADIPAGAVNWSDEDGVSEIHPMQHGADVLIIRYFEDNLEDPLEGRREGVSLIDSSSRQYSLEANCVNAGGFVEKEGNIAFVCAREQAGIHLLHSVVAYNSKAEKMIEIEYCRNPSWSGAHEIECDRETVGPEGELTLHPHKVTLSARAKHE
jgi:hypothetical protein